MSFHLGLDPGYGDLKITYGDNAGNIKELYKFNSILGRIDLSELIQDDRARHFDGHDYYIGPLALNLETDRIIDIIDYKNLEYFTPLFIEEVISQLVDKGYEVPTIIVCGLSIAHIQHSAYYKEAIVKHLTGRLGYTLEVKIIPQGIGGKIAFDKYGIDFPHPSRTFSDYQNYVGIDIGFNTLDIFQVIEGKTTSNNIKGIENEGVIKVAKLLLDYIEEQYNTTFSIKECKAILDSGRFKVRGVEHVIQTKLEAIKKGYISQVQGLVEQEFGKVLDKTDKMRLFGGGSYMFQSVEDPFIEVPKTRAEYYNSIGNYLYSLR